MPGSNPTPSAHTQLVSLQKAAEHLHISVKTLRRRIADGTVTGYRVGRLVRVDLDEVAHRLVVAIPTAHSAA